MRKGKFNYIDVIIIIVVIAAIIGGLLYLNKDSSAEVVVSGKEHIVFVAEAEYIDSDAIQNLQVGDSLVALESFQDAKIMDIQVYDMEAISAVNGEIITYTVADKVRLVITIEGNANKYGPYIEIGGQKIKAGSSYWIKTDTMQALGKVVKIVE